MYRIICDDFPILDLRDDDLIVSEPKLDLESNTCGSCTFTMHQDHPYYNNPRKMKSVVTVLEDNSVIFKGRVYSDKSDWNNSKNMQIEGILSYFNDSVVSPFKFPDDFINDSSYVNSTNVVQFFLNWIITNHNSQVEDFQKFRLGTVTVSDPNNYINRSSEDYLSSWQCLSDKLFNSSLGGYLCIRYEADGNYIDYFDELPLTNTQDIEFGENLLNLTAERSAADTVSAVMPIGKEGLTIEEYPDGDLTSDMVKYGKVIYSRAAVDTYGYICRIQKFDDITDYDNLKNKGMSWLGLTGSLLSNNIEINAVDLHFTDDNINSFRINRKTIIRSPAHNFDAIYDLTKLSIDLLNPQNTVITFGNSFLSLTESNQNDSKRIDSAVSAKIETTKNEIHETILSESESTRTSCNSTSQAFFQEAIKDYVKVTDFGEYQETVSTQIEQTAENIQMNFTTINNDIINVNNDLQRIYAERNRYIRFEDGNIILGEEGNELTLKLENDRISFVSSNLEVAYFSNRKLYVTDGEYLNSLKLGKFAFLPRENGNLSFVIVRG